MLFFQLLMILCFRVLSQRYIIRTSNSVQNQLIKTSSLGKIIMLEGRSGLRSQQFTNAIEISMMKVGDGSSNYGILDENQVVFFKFRKNGQISEEIFYQPTNSESDYEVDLEVKKSVLKTAQILLKMLNKTYLDIDIGEYRHGKATSRRDVFPEFGGSGCRSMLRVWEYDGFVKMHQTQHVPDDCQNVIRNNLYGSGEHSYTSVKLFHQGILKKGVAEYRFFMRSDTEVVVKTEIKRVGDDAGDFNHPIPDGYDLQVISVNDNVDELFNDERRTILGFDYDDSELSSFLRAPFEESNTPMELTRMLEEVIDDIEYGSDIIDYMCRMFHGEVEDLYFEERKQLLLVQALSEVGKDNVIAEDTLRTCVILNDHLDISTRKFGLIHLHISLDNLEFMYSLRDIEEFRTDLFWWFGHFIKSLSEREKDHETFIKVVNYIEQEFLASDLTNFVTPLETMKVSHLEAFLPTVYLFLEDNRQSTKATRFCLELLDEYLDFDGVNDKVLEFLSHEVESIRILSFVILTKNRDNIEELISQMENEDVVVRSRMRFILTSKEMYHSKNDNFEHNFCSFERSINSRRGRRAAMGLIDILEKKEFEAYDVHFELGFCEKINKIFGTGDFGAYLDFAMCNEGGFAFDTSSLSFPVFYVNMDNHFTVGIKIFGFDFKIFDIGMEIHLDTRELLIDSKEYRRETKYPSGRFLPGGDTLISQIIGNSKSLNYYNQMATNDIRLKRIVTGTINEKQNILPMMFLILNHYKFSEAQNYLSFVRHALIEGAFNSQEVLDLSFFNRFGIEVVPTHDADEWKSTTEWTNPLIIKKDIGFGIQYTLIENHGGLYQIALSKTGDSSVVRNYAETSSVVEGYLINHVEYEKKYGESCPKGYFIFGKSFLCTQNADDSYFIEDYVTETMRVGGNSNCDEDETYMQIEDPSEFSMSGNVDGLAKMFHFSIPDWMNSIVPISEFLDSMKELENCYSTCSEDKEWCDEEFEARNNATCESVHWYQVPVCEMVQSLFNETVWEGPTDMLFERQKNLHCLCMTDDEQNSYHKYNNPSLPDFDGVDDCDRIKKMTWIPGYISHNLYWYCKAQVATISQRKFLFESLDSERYFKQSKKDELQTAKDNLETSINEIFDEYKMWHSEIPDTEDFNTLYMFYKEYDQKKIFSEEYVDNMQKIHFKRAYYKWYVQKHIETFKKVLIDAFIGRNDEDGACEQPPQKIFNWLVKDDGYAPPSYIIFIASEFQKCTQTSNNLKIVNKYWFEANYLKSESHGGKRIWYPVHVEDSGSIMSKVIDEDKLRVEIPEEFEIDLREPIEGEFFIIGEEEEEEEEECPDGEVCEDPTKTDDEKKEEEEKSTKKEKKSLPKFEGGEMVIYGREIKIPINIVTLEIEIKVFIDVKLSLALSLEIYKMTLEGHLVPEIGLKASLMAALSVWLVRGGVEGEVTIIGANMDLATILGFNELPLELDVGVTFGQKVLEYEVFAFVEFRNKIKFCGWFPCGLDWGSRMKFDITSGVIWEGSQSFSILGGKKSTPMHLPPVPVDIHVTSFENEIIRTILKGTDDLNQDITFSIDVEDQVSDMFWCGDLHLDPDSGDLTIIPPRYWSGKCQINFRVHDPDYISSNTGIVLVDVQPMATPPILILSTNKVLSREEMSFEIVFSCNLVDRDGSEKFDKIWIDGLPKLLKVLHNDSNTKTIGNDGKYVVSTDYEYGFNDVWYKIVMTPPKDEFYGDPTKNYGFEFSVYCQTRENTTDYFTSVVSDNVVVTIVPVNDPIIVSWRGSDIIKFKELESAVFSASVSDVDIFNYIITCRLEAEVGSIVIIDDRIEWLHGTENYRKILEFEGDIDAINEAVNSVQINTGYNQYGYGYFGESFVNLTCCDGGHYGEGEHEEWDNINKFPFFEYTKSHCSSASKMFEIEEVNEYPQILEVEKAIVYGTTPSKFNITFIDDSEDLTVSLSSKTGKMNVKFPISTLGDTFTVSTGRNNSPEMELKTTTSGWRPVMSLIIFEIEYTSTKDVCAQKISLEISDGQYTNKFDIWMMREKTESSENNNQIPNKCESGVCETDKRRRTFSTDDLKNMPNTLFYSESIPIKVTVPECTSGGTFCDASESNSVVVTPKVKINQYFDIEANNNICDVCMTVDLMDYNHPECRWWDCYPTCYDYYRLGQYPRIYESTEKTQSGRKRYCTSWTKSYDDCELLVNYDMYNDDGQRPGEKIHQNSCNIITGSPVQRQTICAKFSEFHSTFPLDLEIRLFGAIPYDNGDNLKVHVRYWYSFGGWNSICHESCSGNSYNNKTPQLINEIKYDIDETIEVEITSRSQLPIIDWGDYKMSWEKNEDGSSIDEDEIVNIRFTMNEDMDDLHGDHCDNTLLDDDMGCSYTMNLTVLTDGGKVRLKDSAATLRGTLDWEEESMVISKISFESAKLAMSNIQYKYNGEFDCVNFLELTLTDNYYYNERIKDGSIAPINSFLGYPLKPFPITVIIRRLNDAPKFIWEGDVSSPCQAVNLMGMEEEEVSLTGLSLKDVDQQLKPGILEVQPTGGKIYVKDVEILNGLLTTSEYAKSNEKWILRGNVEKLNTFLENLFFQGVKDFYGEANVHFKFNDLGSISDDHVSKEVQQWIDITLENAPDDPKIYTDPKIFINEHFRGEFLKVKSGKSYDETWGRTPRIMSIVDPDLHPSVTVTLECQKCLWMDSLSSLCENDVGVDNACMCEGDILSLNNLFKDLQLYEPTGKGDDLIVITVNTTTGIARAEIPVWINPIADPIQITTNRLYVERKMEDQYIHVNDSYLSFVIDGGYTYFGAQSTVDSAQKITKIRFAISENHYAGHLVDEGDLNILFNRDLSFSNGRLIFPNEWLYSFDEEGFDAITMKVPSGSYGLFSIAVKIYSREEINGVETHATAVLYVDIGGELHPYLSKIYIDDGTHGKEGHITTIDSFFTIKNHIKLDRKDMGCCFNITDGNKLSIDKGSFQQGPICKSAIRDFKTISVSPKKYFFGISTIDVYCENSLGISDRVVKQKIYFENVHTDMEILPLFIPASLKYMKNISQGTTAFFPFEVFDRDRNPTIFVSIGVTGGNILLDAQGSHENIILLEGSYDGIKSDKIRLSGPPDEINTVLSQITYVPYNHSRYNQSFFLSASDLVTEVHYFGEIYIERVNIQPIIVVGFGKTGLDECISVVEVNITIEDDSPSDFEKKHGIIPRLKISWDEVVDIYILSKFVEDVRYIKKDHANHEIILEGGQQALRKSVRSMRIEHLTCNVNFTFSGVDGSGSVYFEYDDREILNVSNNIVDNSKQGTFVVNITWENVRSAEIGEYLTQIGTTGYWKFDDCVTATTMEGYLQLWHVPPYSSDSFFSLDYPENSAGVKFDVVFELVEIHGTVDGPDGVFRIGDKRTGTMVNHESTFEINGLRLDQIKETFQNLYFNHYPYPRGEYKYAIKISFGSENRAPVDFFVYYVGTPRECSGCSTQCLVWLRRNLMDSATPINNRRYTTMNENCTHQRGESITVGLSSTITIDLIDIYADLQPINTDQLLDVRVGATSHLVSSDILVNGVSEDLTHSISNDKIAIENYLRNTQIDSGLVEGNVDYLVYMQNATQPGCISYIIPITVTFLITEDPEILSISTHHLVELEEDQIDISVDWKYESSKKELYVLGLPEGILIQGVEKDHLVCHKDSCDFLIGEYSAGKGNMVASLDVKVFHGSGHNGLVSGIEFVARETNIITLENANSTSYEIDFNIYPKSGKFGISILDRYLELTEDHTLLYEIDFVHVFYVWRDYVPSGVLNISITSDKGTFNDEITEDNMRTTLELDEKFVGCCFSMYVKVSGSVEFGSHVVEETIEIGIHPTFAEIYIQSVSDEEISVLQNESFSLDFDYLLVGEDDELHIDIIGLEYIIAINSFPVMHHSHSVFDFVPCMDSHVLSSETQISLAFELEQYFHGNFYMEIELYTLEKSLGHSESKTFTVHVTVNPVYKRSTLFGSNHVESFGKNYAMVDLFAFNENDIVSSPCKDYTLSLYLPIMEVGKIELLNMGRYERKDLYDVNQILKDTKVRCVHDDFLDSQFIVTLDDAGCHGGSVDTETKVRKEISTNCIPVNHCAEIVMLQGVIYGHDVFVGENNMTNIWGVGNAAVILDYDPSHKSSYTVILECSHCLFRIDIDGNNTKRIYNNRVHIFDESYENVNSFLNSIEIGGKRNFWGDFNVEIKFFDHSHSGWSSTETCEKTFLIPVHVQSIILYPSIFYGENNIKLIRRYDKETFLYLDFFTVDDNSEGNNEMGVKIKCDKCFFRGAKNIEYEIDMNENKNNETNSSNDSDFQFGKDFEEDFGSLSSINKEIVVNLPKKEINKYLKFIKYIPVWRREGIVYDSIVVNVFNTSTFKGDYKKVVANITLECNGQCCDVKMCKTCDVEGVCDSCAAGFSLDIYSRCLSSATLGFINIGIPIISVMLACFFFVLFVLIVILIIGVLLWGKRKKNKIRSEKTNEIELDDQNELKEREMVEVTIKKENTDMQEKTGLDKKNEILEKENENMDEYKPEQEIDTDRKLDESMGSEEKQKDQEEEIEKGKIEKDDSNEEKEMIEREESSNDEEIEKKESEDIKEKEDGNEVKEVKEEVSGFDDVTEEEDPLQLILKKKRKKLKKKLKKKLSKQLMDDIIQEMKTSGVEKTADDIDEEVKGKLKSQLKKKLKKKMKRVKKKLSKKESKK